MSDKIILKYNAVVGRDPLPKIQELVAALTLRLEDVAEENPAAGKRLRVVRISGESKKLLELARKLRRFPSITSKIV